LVLSLDDDLLAAIADRPFSTSRQLGDAVGESDGALVSKRLGVLRKEGLIEKNGQSLWCVSSLCVPSDKARDAVAVLDADPESVVVGLDDVYPLEAEFVALAKQLEPVVLPSFGGADDLQLEIETLRRLEVLLCPSIGEVLASARARLAMIVRFEQAKAA
jgi:hypothetical protein